MLADLLMLAGFAAGLLGYSWGCRWVHRHATPGRPVLWRLERVRASLAYEGDPGPKGEYR